MDLSQIRTLLHVAEIGSLSGAAQRLGVAQPALSRQIRLLEQELGAPVFERHGRGMTPTELGRKLLEPAGKVLSHLDEMRRLATQEATSFVGRVRVGVTPTVAEVATLPLVERIRDAHPLLSLSFTSGFSGHLVEWLKRDELDVCVAYETQTGGLVSTRPVLDETLILIGSAARGLNMTRPVSFAALAGEQLVLPSPAHGLRTILDACASRAGIVLSPSLEADSLQAMIDLVGGGFGLTVLPLAPVHSRLERGELSAAPLIEPIPTRRVMVAYPADRPITPATRFVGEAFAAVACELVASQVWAGNIVDAFSQVTK